MASSPTATNLASRTHDPVWDDLNNDTWPDLLWQNNDGLLFAWLLTGQTQTGGSYLNPNQVPAEWRVVGLADFDGNGSSDILFRHTTGGWLFVWWMDQITRTGGEYLTPNVAPTSWVVAAIDDFNGDHKADIVWQEPSSGLIYIWFMNGPTQTSATFTSPAQVPPAWRITGAGDLNNDGHADLVFRHTDGWTFAWFMNGATQIGSSFVTSSAFDPTWQIVALADFNHDSHQDLLFYNSASQSLFIVYLNGVAQQGAGEFVFSSSIAPPQWRVVGAR